jgi:hypothetical protein
MFFWCVGLARQIVSWVVDRFGLGTWRKNHKKGPNTWNSPGLNNSFSKGAKKASKKGAKRGAKRGAKKDSKKGAKRGAKKEV